jgi:hypothetical protein
MDQTPPNFQYLFLYTTIDNLENYSLAPLKSQYWAFGFVEQISQELSGFNVRSSQLSTIVAFKSND